MTITDQLGRKIQLSATPKRIVSLVPSQTELLIDLGLEEELVGITKFCVHPKQLREVKKVVGGTKEVHLEKIKTLNPDLILCNKEENTKEMVLALEKIAPVHVSDIIEIGDAFSLMRQYGEIFKKEALAKTMITTIKRKMKVLQESLSGKPIKKVAYFIWKKPLMVVGKDTFVDKLLSLNNFENVFKESRYPATTLKEVKEKNPDLLLLSSEPFPFQEKHKTYFSEVDAEIMLVDGEYFSWYGSRLAGAMDYFKKLRD
ncbi:ABC-type Fe3+-hydroxamate transport system, substrate-binding protein [Salegentibacter echinorum]|uniref:ABC-type Fe3+-hydroxamate transport system, substrate-binding protein n=1 Tax=Salegentibacter echinorum TaxID=1073325 RepID=A0A1M5BZP0_SALEC|nr:helical backbone metal receptor [Salegentibacter echinorum]SHF47880.1 ABC-type Fe3+-hydroxamate transport system, substrate-binding protein [Salegentibacter echinorum]